MIMPNVVEESTPSDPDARRIGAYRLQQLLG
jgi:hypothetical protein